SNPNRRSMDERSIERPDRFREPIAASQFGVVEKPLSTWERVYNTGGARKIFILALLAIVWELYARWLNNPLLFPTFVSTIEAFIESIASGGLPGKAWTSLKVLMVGYACGIGCAALLTVLAITSRIGTDLLETLTSMFNPLPAIALLPLALIW